MTGYSHIIPHLPIAWQIKIDISHTHTYTHTHIYIISIYLYIYISIYLYISIHIHMFDISQTSAAPDGDQSFAKAQGLEVRSIAQFRRRREGTPLG